jgi:hypothetical protein
MARKASYPSVMNYVERFEIFSDVQSKQENARGLRDAK